MPTTFDRAHDIVEYALERATVAEIIAELDRRSLEDHPLVSPNSICFTLASRLLMYRNHQIERPELADSVNEFLKEFKKWER